jgi:hypothetical protein
MTITKGWGGLFLAAGASFAACGSGNSANNHLSNANCTPNGSPSTAANAPNDPGTDCCSQFAFAGMCASADCIHNGLAVQDPSDCCSGNGATAGTPPDTNLYCNPIATCGQPGAMPNYSDGTDCCTGSVFTSANVLNYQNAGPSQLVGTCSASAGLPLPCTSTAQCPQGTATDSNNIGGVCVPNSNGTGLVSGSWVCQPVSGAAYQGCALPNSTADTDCPNNFDCWSFGYGGTGFCTTSCNTDSDCGQPGVACCDTSTTCVHVSCKAGCGNSLLNCAGSCVTCGSF